MKALVIEFLGTMFLVLAIALTGNPLAIGLMLVAMVYIGGHISGAHYNPAVTLAIYMRGKFESSKVIPYMLSQVAGALVAAFVFFLVKERTFYPSPGFGVAFWQALIIEVLFTFVLAMVVLTVTSKKFQGNFVYGLAIGLTVTAIAFAGGSISGGAYNPAVALGPIIFDSLMGGYSYYNTLLYLLGPFVGGILAALFFKHIAE